MRTSRRPTACSRQFGFVTGAILCVLLAGCGPAADVNRYQPDRTSIYYTNAEVSDIPAPRITAGNPREIDGKTVPVTRCMFSAESVALNVAMSQKIPVRRDHRLTGFRFPIRCLDGPGVLKPLIVSPGSDKTNYLSDDIIHLTPSVWKTVVLNFSGFTDSRTGLNTLQDTFFPGEWDTVLLLLIPWEENGREQIYEWGPLEGIRQTRRYRFH